MIKIKKKEVINRLILENAKTKTENELVEHTNNILIKFTNALLKGQTVGIDLGLKGPAKEFILKYFNESNLWIVQEPEVPEEDKKELILFTLK